MATDRSDMEETGTNTTKVSDSAYSNSCSNSQSQRSGSNSSKSHHSTSSGSSGYCGHPSTVGSSNDTFPQPPMMKRIKDKEHKKKKLKSITANSCSANATALDTNDASNNSGTRSNNPPTDNVSCNNNKAFEVDPTLVSNFTTPSIDSEALQIAALSQTLSCIKKIKSKDIPLDENEGTPAQMTNITATDQEQIINSLKTEVIHEEEFCAVVSMQDGVVLYTTPNLTDVLGFPKDMWIGRSLIDFVHPKDRIAFASHITSGIANPLIEHHSKNGNTGGSGNKRNSFFCCLRQYRGLKSCGYGVIDKKVSYLPCHLTMSFREVPPSRDTAGLNSHQSAHGIFLVVTVQTVRAAYKYPDETRISQKFMTRHSATSQLTHVDNDVVPYFGYLPQDMLRKSIFDFYHPEDMLFLKEVYQSVMKEQGLPFRSKPYRFRSQNGGFVLVETEWSSFINPWTRKLEFVIGQHRVLKGPPNPDVTTPVQEVEPLQVSEEVMKEAQIIQEEIQCVLSEAVLRTAETAKKQVSKCCKDLAMFMETLMDEIAKPQDIKLDVPTDDHSFSERDSVMLGEISPHHDYCDSKSSSETPPSYNQLNYNENIQRFFESKPKTTLSDESGESKNEANPDLSGGDEEEKSRPPVKYCSTSRNSECCFNKSGGSGASSGLSSGSAGNIDSSNSRGNTSATNTSNTSRYKPPHLTEELLCKHNEDMEKQMVQRHREQRNKGERESKNKDRHKCSFDKIQEEQCCHGVKRSGSHSWEGEPYKSIKQTHGINDTSVTPVHDSAHTQCDHNSGNIVKSNMAQVKDTRSGVYPSPAANPNVNLWPPFSVTVTPLHMTQPCATHVSYSTPLVNPIMPMYYMGTITSSSNTNQCTAQDSVISNMSQPSGGHTQQTSYMAHQVQYLPSMLYPLAVPMFGAPPMMYSSTTLLPTPVMQPMKPQNTRPEQAPTANQSMNVQRPPSQATSVKAELGSVLCSIASASLKQALSEKEGKSLCSPGSFTSPPLSSIEKPKESNLEADTNSNNDLMGDDGSYYSSFYSFLKTDKSDDSMKSLPQNGSSENIEEMAWEKTERRGNNPGETNKTKPIRKQPPWLEDIIVTPELIFRYQVNERGIDEVLQADLEALARIHQPLMVNDQLSQLYVDLEGLSKQLTLEESITSSSGSSSDDMPPSRVPKPKKKRSLMEYDRMVMIFEENAPLPPPKIDTLITVSDSS